MNYFEDKMINIDNMTLYRIGPSKNHRHVMIPVINRHNNNKKVQHGSYHSNKTSF